MKKIVWIGIGVIIFVIIAVVLLGPQRSVLTIGSPLPDFRLDDLTRTPFFAGNARGKVILINFWATWCTYCREELPHLETLHQKYAGQGFQSISILQDPNNIDLAMEICRRNAITYPVLLDRDGRIFQIFGVSNLPYTVLVGRDGTIRFIHFGFHEKDLPAYDREIRQLLSEK